ncbi:MAG: VanZ family protein [Bacteroidales bacterium]|nr:VanZ family protein [Bacteroidales bacterium]MBQ4477817.1 VanZ family protein [Bacteroidales bacterium]MBR4454170.1 VanZ family protein [Bacteroidales bacterium]MCR5554196.1 VanZ family protein [Bacteroidales bacterium]
MKKTFQSYRLLILWVGLVFLLIAVPGEFIPVVRTFRDWLQWDKLVHFLLFGGVAFLLLWGREKQQLQLATLPYYIIAFFSGTLYGGFTEWYQSLSFVRRDGNIFDFYADTLGSLLGVLLFFLLKNKVLAYLKQHNS